MNKFTRVKQANLSSVANETFTCYEVKLLCRLLWQLQKSVQG